MRTGITITIAAALILAAGLVMGMVVSGKTVAASDSTSKSRRYDRHFGQLPEMVSVRASSERARTRSAIRTLLGAFAAPPERYRNEIGRTSLNRGDGPPSLGLSEPRTGLGDTMRRR